MLVEMLQAKIRYAHVTESNPEYKGSVTIDEDLMDEMGVLPFQRCEVNSMSGFRGFTYIIPGKRGSGCVGANGALAAHILKGDIIHINVFCLLSKESAHGHTPIIIESNQ